MDTILEMSNQEDGKLMLDTFDKLKNSTLHLLERQLNDTLKGDLDFKILQFYSLAAGEKFSLLMASINSLSD